MPQHHPDGVPYPPIFAERLTEPTLFRTQPVKALRKVPSLAEAMAEAWRRSVEQSAVLMAEIERAQQRRRDALAEQQEQQFQRMLLEQLCGEHGRVIGQGRLTVVYDYGGHAPRHLTREDMLDGVRYG